MTQNLEQEKKDIVEMSEMLKQISEEARRDIKNIITGMILARDLDKPA